MPDYKAMYLSLFNSVTDAIELLKQAQEKTEEMYIESGEAPLAESEGTELQKSNVKTTHKENPQRITL